MTFMTRKIYIVRFFFFYQDLHKHLEQKLAQFHEREDCILYASCFDANAGLFEVFKWLHFVTITMFELCPILLFI